MTADRVTAAIADLRRRARLLLDPSRRGPVPLDQLFKSECVTHVAIPQLSLATVARHLIAERYVNDPDAVADMMADDAPLEGLMYWQSGDGLAFIKAEDILPRRRFTAAHELGHAVLHKETMRRYLSDPKISETDGEGTEMEAEANRFPAELLMPEEVIRARADEMRGDFKACPRLVLAYRLASELLVSRQAINYRLSNLKGVCDDG